MTVSSFDIDVFFAGYAEALASRDAKRVTPFWGVPALVLSDQGVIAVAKIEGALKALNGVSDAKVFFNTGKIEVQHDPQIVKSDELVQAVKSVGYEAREAAF